MYMSIGNFYIKYFSLIVIYIDHHLLKDYDISRVIYLLYFNLQLRRIIHSLLKIFQVYLIYIFDSTKHIFILE